MANKEWDRFFQDKKNTDNGYFTFKQVLAPVEDKPNSQVIYLITDNVRMVKGKKILIIGENRSLYLKDWQVESVIVRGANQSCDVVRLNQSFCQTPFKFRDKYEGYEGMELLSFEDLKNMAMQQERDKVEVKKISVPIKKEYKFPTPDTPRKNSPTKAEVKKIKNNTDMDKEYAGVPF